MLVSKRPTEFELVVLLLVQLVFRTENALSERNENHKKNEFYLFVSHIEDLSDWVRKARANFGEASDEVVNSSAWKRALDQFGPKRTLVWK